MSESVGESVCDYAQSVSPSYSCRRQSSYEYGSGQRNMNREKRGNGSKTFDIGNMRNKVMQELYQELYPEIKQEVKEVVIEEKPKIVKEISQELIGKIKRDLRGSFPEFEDGGK